MKQYSWMDLANKEDFGLASYFYSKSLFQKRIRPTESGSKNYTGFKL
jgi:acyl-CoA reductase-like NAD-dependent aldehyde dehydrogenase